MSLRKVYYRSALNQDAHDVQISTSRRMLRIMKSSHHLSPLILKLRLLGWQRWAAHNVVCPPGFCSVPVWTCGERAVVDSEQRRSRLWYEEWLETIIPNSLYGHPDCTRLLLQNVSTPVNETAGLRYMQCSDVDIQALRNRWIQAAPPSTHVQNDGPTLLFTASQCGHLDIVQLLIKSGVALDCCDNGGWTPIDVFVATRMSLCYPEVTQPRCRVNAQKADLWTPLHLTSATGHLNISQFLIQRRAEVDKRDELKKLPSGIR